MKKLVIVCASIAVAVIIGWTIYHLLQQRNFAGAGAGPAVPTSCPPPTTTDCPGPGDVDANGCPTGGYDSTTSECVVTFGFYQKFAGCKDEHYPMAFYTKASVGNPSKYHLRSGVNPVQAAFTEIDCKPPHDTVGAVNAGQPFVSNPNVDFSKFKNDHISDVANPAVKDKCFKVTVNPKEIDYCIDPHIIIK